MLSTDFMEIDVNATKKPVVSSGNFAKKFQTINEAVLCFYNNRSNLNEMSTVNGTWSQMSGRCSMTNIHKKFVRSAKMNVSVS